MTKNMDRRPLLTAILLTVLVAAALFSGSSLLFAQGEQPDQPEETAPHLTEAMQAFLDNQEAGRPSEALAATPCVAGMAGIYPCNNIDLMAFLPVGTFSASATNDIWGWTDPLNGDEYALLGLNNGTAFVDVTDPENPVYLGKLPTQTGSSSWRDVKVYADYAFIVSEASGHGMQIFDLTELRTVVGPPVTFANSAHYSDFGNAHNVVINEDSGFAYGVGTSTCSGGLHMVNISNPLSPSGAGCFSGDGYTHDAQCVNYVGPDPDYAGAEICFNSNTDTLTIVDVTNKAAPQQISRNGYPGVGYTHQGWILDGHRYFLLGDEADESDNGHNTRTYIWDLADLDNPVLMGNYTGPNASIDHNMYTVGTNVFQSNYSSGLRILDLGDVSTASLTEVAFFDTYPPNNSANFSGSWSNYPYFDSGNVVVSGIGEGLFILSPALAPDFSLNADSEALSVCGNGSDSLTLDLTARNGYTGTVTLSTAGLPGGAVSAFSPNPVNPPDTSDLTVTTTAVPAGDYPFSIIGSDLPLSHTVDATLHVNDGVPGPGVPGLLSPSDGAVDQELLPLLDWSGVAQGTSYYLEVALDAGFTNVVYTATTAETSHTLTAPLDPLTLYYWRVRADNICGSGGFSVAFDFTTKPIPPILLVDDDDNGPDVRSFYTDGLDSLGLDYDIWDTGNSDNEPSLGLLSPYSTIIWFTGDEFGGAAGPGASSEAALGDWLDAGNCLFVSSQDYRFDRGQTPFMSDYLGVSSSSNDNGDYTSVIGQGSVFGGLGGNGLTYPFPDYSDIISPSGSAELAFEGNNGNSAAVNKDNGTYKTVFFGFPWEAIGNVTSRHGVLETVLDWCGEELAVGTLAGTVTDADGGSPVNGAMITADNGDDTETTATDGNGDYDLSLPIGAYDVTVSAAGYLSQTVSGVNVLSGTTTIQDFSLVAAVGTLERDQDEIEATLSVGERVTNTLVISNSGTVAFDFTVSENADWAEVLPVGGTLNPGQSMIVEVVFDSTAVAGAGSYSELLSFSGTYDNAPADVDLILHVVEDSTYRTFMPMVIGEGAGFAGNSSPGKVGTAVWLLPLVGIVGMVARFVKSH